MSDRVCIACLGDKWVIFSLHMGQSDYCKFSKRIILWKWKRHSIKQPHGWAIGRGFQYDDDIMFIWDKLNLLWLDDTILAVTLHWRHNECDDVSNHLRLGCLLNCLFRRRSKKTSKLRVTGLCEGNSMVTGEFPAQRASNTVKVSISWRHHDCIYSGHCW